MAVHCHKLPIPIQRTPWPSFSCYFQTVLSFCHQLQEVSCLFAATIHEFLHIILDNFKTTVCNHDADASNHFQYKLYVLGRQYWARFGVLSDEIWVWIRHYIRNNTSPPPPNQRGQAHTFTHIEAVHSPALTKYVDPYSPRQEKEDSHGNVKLWQWDFTCWEVALRILFRNFYLNIKGVLYVQLKKYFVKALS